MVLFSQLIPDEHGMTAYQRERKIMHARLVSHNKWNRRRRVLRLRAMLFGRRKHRIGQVVSGRCAAQKPAPLT